MIRSLLASTALAPLALFCLPAKAQNVTGLQLGAIRSATQLQPCLLARGPNICDPFGVLDLTTGAFTPPPLVIPYTNTMLNTNTDLFRVQIGNLPQAWEFPNTGGSTNFSTAAIVGAVAIPPGTYSGATPGWPDFGIAGYAITGNPNKYAVGILGNAGISVTGGNAEAFNGILQNCEIGKSTCVDGGGYNFSNLIVGENDLNIWALPGGAGPTGGAMGHRVVLQATTVAMTNVNAVGYNVNAAGTGKWGVAYQSDAGATSVFASIGPQAKTGASDSQLVFLNANNGTGPVSSNYQGTRDGGFLLNTGFGGAFALRAAYPQISYSQPLAGAPVGMEIANPSTAVNSQSTFTWRTGTTNSTASAVLTDNSIFAITTGSVISQILLQAGGASQSINLASPTFVTAMVGAGYVKGSNAIALNAVATIPTTDLSGTLQAAQFPALTGDVTTTAGSLATAIGAGRVTNAMLAGSIAASKLVGTDIATVGTLTAGATGAGFTIALGTSTVTGTLPAANTAALTGDVTKTAGTNPTVLATAQPAVHTWALAQTFTVAPVFTDASGTRTALGLGTAATVNTGTSGATIPLLNGANTFSALNTFSAGLAVPVSAATAPTIDASGQTAVSVTNGGSGALAFDNMGMIIVTDTNTGHTAIYIMLAGGANLVAMDSNWTTGTAPGAGFSSIAWNGSTFAVYNNTGATHGYKLVNFRTH